jgi:hypothetical protein
MPLQWGQGSLASNLELHANKGEVLQTALEFSTDEACAGEIREESFL